MAHPAPANIFCHSCWFKITRGRKSCCPPGNSPAARDASPCCTPQSSGAGGRQRAQHQEPAGPTPVTPQLCWHSRAPGVGANKDGQQERCRDVRRNQAGALRWDLWLRHQCSRESSAPGRAAGAPQPPPLPHLFRGHRFPPVWPRQDPSGQFGNKRIPEA